MAGLAIRALGLLHILVFLAPAGCSYVDNRDGPSRAPGKAARKAPPPRTSGIFHVVKKGENLYRIGKAYGIDHVTLARTNRVPDARDLRIGRRLFVPGATRRLPVEIITPIKEPLERAPAPKAARGKTRKTPSVKPAPARAPRAAVTPRKRPPATAAPGKKSSARAATPKSPRPTARATRPRSGSRRQPFTWPVRGKITARFDSRHDTLNDGIDIAAPSGTPVRATLAGQVIYSDRLRGYGNLIIVRHRGGYASVYAHNRRNLVRQGQKVTQRQVIAEVGATGRVTTPHLHFEIRRNNVARDPLSYLP